MDGNFNWDDIEVGDIHLNHSENFFARKHWKHEKSMTEELDLTQDLVNASLSDVLFSNGSENKENCSEPQNKNASIKEESQASPLKVHKTENVQKIEIKVEDYGQCSLKVNEIVEVKKELCEPSPKGRMEEILEKSPSGSDLNKTFEALEIKENEEKETQCAAAAIVEEIQSNKDIDMDTTAKPLAAPLSNLAFQWSTQKKVKRAPLVGKPHFTKPDPPKAYQFSEIYQRKKENALRRKLEEEKKMREFHCRPAPNFNACQKEKKVNVHAITVPVTPQTLKTSREVEKKRKCKLEEILRQQQVPKFEHRSPKVLEEKPFMPKKIQTVIAPKPFHLHSDQRLQERKKFNKVIQQSLEEKKKKEEEEKKRLEEERIKELRKAATFKARPNPFKN